MLPADAGGYREAVLHRLTGYAHLSLSFASRPIGELVCADVADARHRITVRLSPVCDGAPGEQTFPGLFFSPIEAAVYNALQPDRVLLGKELARATGQSYDGGLRIILKNLVERKVLERVRGRGYRVAGSTRRGGKDNAPGSTKSR